MVWAALEFGVAASPDWSAARRYFRGRPSSRMRRNSKWFETRPKCRDRPRYRTRSRDDPRRILEVTRIVGLDEHDVEMNRDDPLKYLERVDDDER